MLMGKTAGVKVYMCLEATDMRRGFDALAALTQTTLAKDPLSGHWFVFRSRSGDRVKVLAWDGSGYALYYKRLEDGQFYWPQAEQGVIELSAAELNVLLEGMDWRRLPLKERFRPAVAA